MASAESFKIDFEGRTYMFDVTRVTTSEWKMVRDYSKQTPFGLFDAVGKTDIESVEALFWLVMRQNSEPPFDMGQRQFGLLGFLQGWNQAQLELPKDEKTTEPQPATAP